MEYTIKKETHYKGEGYNFCTAKITYKQLKLNITYDYEIDNLIIHEWYKIQNRTELTDLIEQLKKYFKNKTE